MCPILIVAAELAGAAADVVFAAAELEEAAAACVVGDAVFPLGVAPGVDEHPLNRAKIVTIDKIQRTRFTY
jgi:hypothetical protein